MNVTGRRYSGKEAAEIAGISYRQIDYWARTGLVRPSLSPATGSGSRRGYSFTDLLELKVIAAMLNAGIKLESIREVFPLLATRLSTGRPSARLVIGAGTAVLVDDDDQLLEVLRAGRFVMTGLLSLEVAYRELLASVSATLEPAPA